MQPVSKLCADHLRVYADARGIKLKAAHAHELVAAFFGYNSRAALLAEQAYPLDHLEDAQLLVPDILRMEQRRACMQGLPMSLASSSDLAGELVERLKAEGLFSGEVRNNG